MCERRGVGGCPRRVALGRSNHGSNSAPEDASITLVCEPEPRPDELADGNRNHAPRLRVRRTANTVADQWAARRSYLRRRREWALTPAAAAKLDANAMTFALLRVNCLRRAL